MAEVPKGPRSEETDLNADWDNIRRHFSFGVYSYDMDLKKIPKQFCENVNIGATPEFFILAMLSGENAMTYALTPQHAKRLSQSLAYNIAEFEKRFGEIKADWTPGVESPLQMLDIKGDKKP